MNDKILFIMEGDKPDKQLLETLLDAYKNVLDYDGDSSNVKVSYKNNIYSLYSELKELDNGEDEFADLFPIVQKKDSNLSTHSRDEFSAIYLFFDLDIHGQQDVFDELKEMVETFDNETENGKLFISYPMVETTKICDKKEGLFKKDRKLFSLGNCKKGGFKQFASDHKKSAIKTDSLENWNIICKENYLKANWILNNDDSIPDIHYLK